ncbi:hypothetical protein FA95DRAFT_1572723 [Auriscalpium vulgare]|uniref:Uncharacterized protein n=1 Tax=Auriscalpium vulgare TaxID=40419 RepID=A0ACB8RT02_9AGAM|nr:hypothetical protein FA95DRAFT_1572723 [Auriscalpium vulgare]
MVDNISPAASAAYNTFAFFCVILPTVIIVGSVGLALRTPQQVADYPPHPLVLALVPYTVACTMLYTAFAPTYMPMPWGVRFLPLMSIWYGTARVVIYFIANTPSYIWPSNVFVIYLLLFLYTGVTGRAWYALTAKYARPRPLVTLRTALVDRRSAKFQQYNGSRHVRTV